MPSLTATSDVKRGSLIIAGTGMASIAQMTLETVTYLKKADRVFYSVGDPVTQAFIQENNNNATDLSVYYEKTKERYQTYVEMAEAILKEVRAGHLVLGLFYGHPGFFALPSHRALTLAREEGYDARMLPGVSSFDYMLSDLEFEPGHYGCAIHEATDILARGRKLDPSMHHVILQIAVAGVTTIQQEETKLQLLVNGLMQDFGPDHRVILYAGAVLPQSSSVMVMYTLEDLLNDQVASGIDSRGSLYIPPRNIPPLNSSATALLGLQAMSKPLLGGRPHWVGPRFVEKVENGTTEKAITTQLDRHTVPENYRYLRGSAAMKRFMIDLALDPAKLKEFQQDPVETVASLEGLTECEKYALELQGEGPLLEMMWRVSDTEPTKDQLELLRWSFDRVLGPATPYCIAF